MRGDYQRYLELEERSRARYEPPLIDPPPRERVEKCLANFAEGDLTGWWLLNRALQLEPRNPRYQHDLNDDLTEFPGWKAAEDELKAQILSAAKRYLTEWQPHPDEWLGTLVIDYPDFSGYRALVLVDSFEPAFLDTLTRERWGDIAPCILGFPTNVGVDEDVARRQQRLVAMAYREAPEAIIASLRKLIDQENSDERREHLYVLKRVERCWDERLIGELFETAQVNGLRPRCLGDLLAELIGHGSSAATNTAKALVPVRTDERTKAIARQAAIVVFLNSDGRGWDVLWPEFVNDREFFREVVTEIADERRQSRRPPAELSEDKLADLYILLSQEFPHPEDLKLDGFVGPREHVQEYRDNLLSALRVRGTTAAVAAIDRIRQALPHLEFLSWTLRAAKRTMLEATWRPLSIDQIRELTQRPASRLVRGGRELQRVIIESLERLQQSLFGETPAIRDLWDKLSKTKWRPVDENALSDYIKRHFQSDLKLCGIVSLREVEIRRGNDTSGERTDIYVTATIYGPTPDSFESVRVLVEVKGCWHAEVQTAMETQLKGRYLKENECAYGVYVVAWFTCDSWDENDPRKKKTPKLQLVDARHFFNAQSQQLSDESCMLTSWACKQFCVARLVGSLGDSVFEQDGEVV